MSIQPVVPNLLDATSAFTNKYTTGNMANPSAVVTALNALPQPQALRPATISNTISPLALYDQARANRGLSPLTARQTAAALKTLQSGRPATEPRRQGIFGAALSDLRALVGGIPKLPISLFREAQQLDDIPGAVAEAVGRADNPFQAIGNIAAAPGIRMVPGAFVANQLLGDKESGAQGLEGVRAHPLFTALDLLPAASGAAKSTRVARTAQDAYKLQVEAATTARRAEGYHPSTAIIPNRPRPLTTALTRRVDPSGQVVPNVLGRGLQDAREMITGTQTGRALEATFAERMSSRLFNRGDTYLREAADMERPVSSLRPPVPGGAAAMQREDALLGVTQDIRRRLRDEKMDEAATDIFFTRATTSRLPDGTPVPPEQMVDLPLTQRALLREIRDLKAAQARYTDDLPGAQSTRTLNIDGRAEVFDYRTAQRISRAQAMETSTREILEARQAALATADSPSALTKDDIRGRLEQIPSRRAAGELTTQAATDLTRLYETALESASRSDIARILPTLRPLARTYPTLPRLIDHLQNARWGPANRDLKQLADTRIGQTLPFDFDELRGEVSRLVARDRTLSRTSHIDERYVAKATRVRERVESRAVPARFDELVGEAARESTRTRVKETFATDPDLDRLIALADEGIFDTLSTRDPRFQRWVREDQAAARASWKALRDAGHDPIYFQRVTRQQAKRQDFIRLADAPTTLKSVQKRMMDATPYIRDAGVIINQEALDILQRRATQATLDDIGKSFGRTRASLVDEYTARASTTRPVTRDQLSERIKKHYVPWEPGNFGGKPTSTFNVESADTLYVPRVMAENIQRMYTPPLPRLTAAFDPILSAFRTAVLPFAVRWHLNNTIGGATVAALVDPGAFREMPNVISKLWGERHSTPAAAERLMSEGMPPAGFGSIGPDVRRWDVDAGSPLKDRLEATAQYAAGGTARRLYDQARESRLAKIPEGFNKAKEMSYGANQFVDDMNRASIAASQRKRFIKAGWSDDAVEALTVQSVRRAFQAWDDMTPMERSVMRSIMPFYGFAQWATKFALKYPFDHPLRVSILNSFAQAELQDALTGLPEYVREMIFLGDPRANEMTRALNVSPFNPLGGVPSMFTVAGFIGQLSPPITTVLQSVGVDVRTGGPQLYPDLRYDPETGRLIANPSGNLASNLLGNTIPQVEGVTALLGFNDEFNSTMARDPAAAGRMLLSQFGMPIIFKDINVGEQLIRTELARLEDQDNARKEALTTGDLSILDDFPGLKAYAAQVQALQDTGQLDQLRPVTGAPGASSGAGKAYALQAALLGQ